MVGKNCFTTSKKDFTLYVPFFGIKSILNCDLTITDISAQCTKANFESMLNFKQANTMAAW